MALDAALPVYAIGTALIMVFSSPLKTDERAHPSRFGTGPRNPKPHKSHICPGRAVGVEHCFPAFQLEQLALSESVIGPRPGSGAMADFAPVANCPVLARECEVSGSLGRSKCPPRPADNGAFLITFRMF